MVALTEAMIGNTQFEVYWLAADTILRCSAATSGSMASIRALENPLALTTGSPMPTSTGLSSCPSCVFVASDDQGTPFSSPILWHNLTISFPLDTISNFLAEVRNTPTTNASTVHGSIYAFGASFFFPQMSSTLILMPGPNSEYHRYTPFIFVAQGAATPVQQQPVSQLSVMTTTKIIGTIEGNISYHTDGPAPSTTAKPSFSAQTTTLPQRSSSSGSPNQRSSTPSPANSPNSQRGSQAFQHTLSQPGSDSNPTNHQTSSSVNENPAFADPANLPTTFSHISQTNAPTEAVAAVPKISDAGTVVDSNEASQDNFPNVDTSSLGGMAMTTNIIFNTLPPSAAALITNGVKSPITSITNNSPEEPPQPGILSFGSTSYTADASSHFIIAGHTLSPGAPAVTVSGTTISLAADATAAVIGASTVPILYHPATSTPTATPVITFAGSTYTADASSAFVIGSQTLRPGASLDVHGTQISYPMGAANVLIGGTTQPFSYAHSPSPIANTPVLTFAGSVYTADASSAFVIDGQTLTPWRHDRSARNEAIISSQRQRGRNRQQHTITIPRNHHSTLSPSSRAHI